MSTLPHLRHLRRRLLVALPCSATRGFNTSSTGTPLHQVRVHNVGRALKAALAVGAAGLFVYWGVSSRVQALPPDVAELCRKGHALMASGAPISAAAEYQKAFNLLSATGADPVHGIDALMWLGNAQDAGKQLNRARDTFTRAEALCRTAERTLPPAYVQRRNITRKHAVTLDRLAQLAVFAGDRAAAAEHYSAAVHLLQVRYGSLVERAQAAAAATEAVQAGSGAGAVGKPRAPASTPAFSEEEQRVLTEFGVILLSRAALLLDARGDGYRARENASLALALLQAALAGARAEAVTLLAHAVPPSGAAASSVPTNGAAAAGGGVEVGPAGLHQPAGPRQTASPSAGSAADAGIAIDAADGATRACMEGLAALLAASRAAQPGRTPGSDAFTASAGALLTQLVELAALVVDAGVLVDRASGLAESEVTAAQAATGPGELN
jgi:tetratricopeptide (TPR) repeat protein